MKKTINTLLVTFFNVNKTKLLHIMLTKASAYVKGYDGQAKWMYFLTEDDDLCDSEPVYNKHF